MIDQQAIEEQIKMFPGNEAALEQLYTLLDEGEAIAFVGAGVSAELWPLWNNFLKSFVDHGKKLGKITAEEADYFKEQATDNPLEIAQQLRNKLGKREYFTYLRETFEDKTSDLTNGAYTQNHEALLQLPIHNYVTLNYDAGLTNARAALYPKATTSYLFWDQDEARRIRNKDFKRLVLHAHGRYDRGDSIILTINDYRRAYDCHPYIRLLNELFSTNSLLFVGFGMTDPYIKHLCNNVSKDSSTNSFSHVAFVGLDEKDQQVAHLHRERVEMMYGARVLFYPSGDNHKALTDWLQMLAEKYSDKPESHSVKEVQPLEATSGVRNAIADQYVHQPTDDEKYKGRTEDFKTLNRWTNDPETRIMGITGIGGQGKTAMTGRWLTHERSAPLQPLPVFYWSFYEDMDVEKFLKQVVEFCLPIVRIQGIVEIDPIHFILSVVKKVRLILVLDGIEVMQEKPESPNHGKVSNPLLSSFLTGWARIPHEALMIITSRFSFPQLERFSGVSFHHLNLSKLSKEDGVTLLESLQVFGDKPLLESYVEKLHGHPLALRVLAVAVKRACHGDLSRFEGDTILVEGDVFSHKLERLLDFYEQQLSGGQRELMGILSLFKRPVNTKSFVTLLSGMKALADTPLANADEATIEQQLNILIDDFLVEKTTEGITTHPVIRDHFRRGHSSTETRKEVADFLQGRPGEVRPATIEEVRDLVEAVQLLCEAGEFKTADELCKARLNEGGYGFNVFRDLPALNEGLECALSFVKNEDRQHELEHAVNKVTVAFYCSGVSLYNYLLGNLDVAIEWRERSLSFRQEDVNRGLSIDLHSIAEIEISKGNIRKAREKISQALKLSYQTQDLNDLTYQLSLKAFNIFLSGNSRQAFEDFAIALLSEQKARPNEKQLYSVSGHQQAEFFDSSPSLGTV